MQHGQDEKGEWLKITYYDEDADVASAFRCTRSPAYLLAFEQLFIRPHTHARRSFTLITAADIVAQQALLRHPDFCGRADEGRTGRCVPDCRRRAARITWLIVILSLM